MSFKKIKIVSAVFVCFTFLFNSIGFTNSAGPQVPLSSLDGYKITPKEDPSSVALKADDMISGLSQSLEQMDINHSIADNDLPKSAMDAADQMVSEAHDAYVKTNQVYAANDLMKGMLKDNYATFNASGKSSDDSNQLNTQSDQMADEVHAQRTAIKAQDSQVQDNIKNIDSMKSGLDQLVQNGNQAENYYDQLINHVKDASNQFEGMAGELQNQGLDAPNTFGQARQFFSSLQDYIAQHKPYTNKEIDYINQSKQYLQKTQDFLNNVHSDLSNVDNQLNDMEQFFRNAKVNPSKSSPLQVPGAPAAVADSCSSLKSDDPNAGKGGPLESQMSCQKSCHTICRQEKKSNGSWCFACASGSPDTCYDVGMLPADTPWCKPGGICATDPELYCQFMGAIGPNKMNLNCAVCKQAPDECFSKVGNDTTNLTHCIQTCPTTCIYKGKYKLSDNPAKFMHCYSCQPPQPPPTCESLGWGWTKVDMCMKNCPDGECYSVTISVGQDGKARIQNPKGPLDQGNPGAPGANPGGVVDNGGGNSPSSYGGTQDKNGPTGANDPINQPNPPTDNGQGSSSSGGGAVAGGGKTQGATNGNPAGTGNPSGGDNKPQKPPEGPKGTQPKEPQAPNSQDKPKPPDDPNIPKPDTWEVNFYKKWIDETQERIKSREDIIKDTKEGEGTKDIARQQLADMTKEKENLETKEKAAQDKVDAEQKEIDNRTKLANTFTKSKDYAAEAKKKGEEWNLGKLKEATDNLKTIAKEAKDSAEARKKRIDDLTNEINGLKKQNDDLSDTVTRGREGSEDAQKQTDDNNKKIDELTQERNVLIQGYKKSQEKYKEDIDKALSDYRTALFRTNEKAKQKVEVERVDEYYNLTQDLARRKQAQAERNDVFNTVEKNLENARDDAKAKGDTSTADDLQNQIDNLKRGQDNWNKMQDTQQATLEEQIYQTGNRNFDEGAGPYNTQSLNDQLNKYSNLLQDQLNNPNLTDDQKANIQATLDGIKDKQNGLNTQQLSPEDKQTIDDTAMKVANSFMSQSADPSFLRLATESLGEEMVNNMNPLTAAKKSLAFGWGVAQGVGQAVKGVVDLGTGATKLLVQSAASDVGLEGLTGTDAVDTLSSVLSTGYNNANPEGFLKAVMAAGAVEDALINDLQKSGDIDWATANFGGKVAGNIIGGELTAPGGAADLVTEARALTQGGEVATDLANAASKTGEVANVAANTEEVANTLTKADEAANATTKIDEAENAVAKTEESANTATKTEEGIGNPAPDETPTVKGNLNEGGPTSTSPGEATPTTEGSGNPAPDETPTVKGDLKGENAPTNEGAQTRAGPQEPATPRTTNEQPYKQIKPNQDFKVQDANGNDVELSTGKQLGKPGSSSTAYVDAQDPTKVIRVTEVGGSGSPEAVTLDKVGREIAEKLETPDGPFKIVKKYEQYTAIDPTNASKGKVIEIVERAQNGSADGFIAENGGKMTQGQVEAFDATTRELNKNGYAWLDDHTGNYGFEKVPGTDDKWKVVIIDSGGIVPATGADLAEKAENASVLQKAVNEPTQRFIDDAKMMEKMPEWVQKGAADDARRVIVDQYGSLVDTDALGFSPNPITKSNLQNQFQNGDQIFDYLKQNGAFTSGATDAQGTVGNLSQALKDGLEANFPEQSEEVLQQLRDSRAVSDVAFYPGGTLKYPELQDMSKLTADEAAKAYKTR